MRLERIINNYLFVNKKMLFNRILKNCNMFYIKSNILLFIQLEVISVLIDLLFIERIL